MSMSCPHFEYCKLFWSPLISEKVQLNWEKLWRQQERWKLALQWGTRNCCLVSIGFFSLEQRQPGLWQRSAEPGVVCREQAGICCSTSLLVQEPGAISEEAGSSQGQPEQKKGVLPLVDRNTPQRTMGMWEGIFPNICIHISLFFVHRPLLEIRSWGRRTFGPKCYHDFDILLTSLFTL